MYSKIAKAVAASIIQKTKGIDSAPVLEELQASGVDNDLLQEIVHLLDRCNLIYESGVPDYATDIAKNNISSLKRKILLGKTDKCIEEELRLLNQPVKIYLGINYSRNTENMYVKSDNGEILTIKKMSNVADLNNHIATHSDKVVYFNDELVFIDKNTSGHINLQ
jgi:hypothetical protein